MRIKILVLTIFGFRLMPCVIAQDQVIDELINKLAQHQTTVSDILSDNSLMYLHSLTPFREMIRQNAKAEKIKITSDKEPGTKITVKGIIVNTAKEPIADALVYVYQTSSEGWYSDTAPHILQNQGDRKHARLFGYFRTNESGAFEFETIKPHGYPHSDLPAHIHFEVSAENRSLITELLFDDDPRLIGNIRTRAEQEKFVISKNTGTEKEPVYFYNISTIN